MATSYKTVSKEVGYQGYMPFPSTEVIDKLLSNLSTNPTISEFKKALSLYRFLPEAKTADQERMIYMLQLALSLSKDILFEKEQKRPLVEVAVSYIMNLIP